MDYTPLEVIQVHVLLLNDAGKLHFSAIKHVRNFVWLWLGWQDNQSTSNNRMGDSKHISTRDCNKKAKLNTTLCAISAVISTYCTWNSLHMETTKKCLFNDYSFKCTILCIYILMLLSTLISAHLLSSSKDMLYAIVLLPPVINLCLYHWDILYILDIMHWHNIFTIFAITFQHWTLYNTKYFI